MEKDFVYPNPPLIEVIAEYRWRLQPIASLPNAAIDPHFSSFEQDLSQRLAQSGYASTEVLTPPQVPLELLAHKVVKRFRHAPDTWPCLQAGPGVFTVNTVPPYGGWGKFRQVIADATSALYQSYPIPERYLKINVAELRYINAFRQDHGYHDIVSFCEQFLNINISIPSVLMPPPERNDHVVMSTEFRIPLADHPSSYALVNLAPGQSKGSNVAILQIAIRKEKDLNSIETLLQWMDEAHGITRNWFQTLVSDAVRERMGPIMEIEA